MRYPDGGRANVARVSIASEASTFTDWTGHYTLQPKSTAGDTVIVYGTDSCRGTCVGTNWGFAKVVLRSRPMVVDLVLDKVRDI